MARVLWKCARGARDNEAMIPNFHAVIPAGGAGTRLWPLSRRDRPKFLHDILGVGSTLLQSTWSRTVPLVDPDHMWVVTGQAHAEEVSHQLPDLRDDRLVREPSPRDSAAAIGLAAALIHRTDPDAVIGSFSADHSITNAEDFRTVITQAVVAASGGDIVTVGITPTYASTAYGYIETGANLGLRAAPTARRALNFVEKPDATTARKYTFSGRYRWNAGMFIARTDAMLELFAQHAPDLYAGLMKIAEVWGTDRQDAVLGEVWPQLEKVAIDYVIAEPAARAGRVVVVPGDFGWDDVGDFDAVAKLRQPAPGERCAVKVIGDSPVISEDSSGVVISTGDRPVALVGLDDVVVVDTDDALLVTSRSSAQKVKNVVARLGDRGLTQIL